MKVYLKIFALNLLLYIALFVANILTSFLLVGIVKGYYGYAAMASYYLFCGIHLLLFYRFWGRDSNLSTAVKIIGALLIVACWVIVPNVFDKLN